MDETATGMRVQIYIRIFSFLLSKYLRANCESLGDVLGVNRGTCQAVFPYGCIVSLPAVAAASCCSAQVSCRAPSVLPLSVWRCTPLWLYWPFSGDVREAHFFHLLIKCLWNLISSSVRSGLPSVLLGFLILATGFWFAHLEYKHFVRQMSSRLCDVVYTFCCQQF